MIAPTLLPTSIGSPTAFLPRRTPRVPHVSAIVGKILRRSAEARAERVC